MNVNGIKMRMMASNPKETAMDWIDNHREQIAKMNDEIWNYAEPALEEFKSSKLLADELESSGFQVTRKIASLSTAFMATFGSGSPVIGIIAEYDALPGLSQKAVTYRAPVIAGGPGHGDAHHCYGVASTAAALALKEAMKQHGLMGTIKLFGTPAEETLYGKVEMANAGSFDGLDAVLSWHPGAENTVRVGSSLANNSVKFVFHGKPTHPGISPELGVNALSALEVMETAVSLLREHFPEAVRVHRVITDGGKAPNVMPERAESWYFVRAPTRPMVDSVYARLVEAAKGAAQAVGTTVDIELICGVREVLPNKALAEIQFQNLQLVGPPTFSEEEKTYARQLQASMGGESKEPLRENISPLQTITGRYSTDSAEVSWLAPLAGLYVTIFPQGVPPHSWQATALGTTGIAHKAVLVAGKVLACSGVDLLTQPEQLSKIRDEFQEKTKGFKYSPCVPLNVSKIE